MNGRDRIESLGVNIDVWYDIVSDFYLCDIESFSGFEVYENMDILDIRKDFEEWLDSYLESFSENVSRLELGKILGELKDLCICDSDYIENGELIELDMLYSGIEELKVSRKKLFDKFLVIKKVCLVDNKGYCGELLSYLECMFRNVNCGLCYCFERVEYSRGELYKELVDEGIKFNDDEFVIMCKELEVLVGIVIK